MQLLGGLGGVHTRGACSETLRALELLVQGGYGTGSVPPSFSLVRLVLFFETGLLCVALAVLKCCSSVDHAGL